MRSSRLVKACLEELEAMRASGTLKRERILESAQGATIRVNGRFVVNLASNNYLGLANDRGVVDAAKAALENRGFGLASVRFICGTQDIHKELEREIADFHGMDDAILFPSAFDANAGLFEALLTEEDAVLSDALNHASIIDGIRLCKAARVRYAHGDLEDLERKLRQLDNKGTRLIATDGAFSMDGDIANLGDLRSIADAHGAFLMIDECHATGVLGQTGRGTPELFGGVKPDILTSTLGKALGGGTGGYAAGPQAVVDVLRNKSRPYLFSNSVSPAVVAASLAVFDKLKATPDLVTTLRRNTHRFRSAMTEHGFVVSGHPDHPIAPVALGDAKLTNRFADALLEEGVFVVGFSYPVVPKGAARLRCQISASHSDDQIDKAVDAFNNVRESLGIPYHHPTISSDE